MYGASPTQGDQGKISGVKALANGNEPHTFGHLCIQHAMYSPGGGVDVQA